MEECKYLVGADVAFATFGICCFKLDVTQGFKFVAADSFRTKKNNKKNKTRVDTDNIRRTIELFTLIDRFFKNNCNNSVFVSAEFPGGSKSSQAALGFGISTGAFVSYLTHKRFPFEQVTPQEVKFISSGRTENVNKKEVEQGISQVMQVEGIDFHGYSLIEYLDNYFPNENARNHIADSVSAAWWSVVNSNNYKSFIA